MPGRPQSSVESHHFPRTPRCCFVAGGDREDEEPRNAWRQSVLHWYRDLGRERIAIDCTTPVKGGRPRESPCRQVYCESWPKKWPRSWMGSILRNPIRAVRMHPKMAPACYCRAPLRRRQSRLKGMRWQERGRVEEPKRRCNYCYSHSCKAGIPWRHRTRCGNGTSY